MPPDQHLVRVEAKLDGLITRQSEFQGAALGGIKDIGRRTGNLEMALEAHKQEHQAELKSKLERQRQREWEKWALAITSIISVAGLVVAVVAVIRHP